MSMLAEIMRRDFGVLLAEKDRIIAEQDRIIAKNDRVIAENDRLIAEKDRAIAEQSEAMKIIPEELDEKIRRLEAENARLKRDMAAK